MTGPDLDTDIETDVLVVGAGLAGLSTAVFLGLHGIPALVVDRHPGTSTQPKARGQNPLVMEALDTAGVAEQVLAAGPAGRAGMTIVISESLAGTVLRNVIEDLDDHAEFSPAPYGLASQARMEEILLGRVGELGGRVRFGTRCTLLGQDADAVTAELRTTGQRRRVRARYLVAADGDRGGLRAALGLGWHGRGRLDATTTVRFRAELGRWAGQDAVVLHNIVNPALPGGSGVIVSTDRRDEWVAGMAPDPDRDVAGTVAVIRTLVGSAAVAPTVLDQATWEFSHRVADSFARGRVLLVGDAAHVMPPTGGQGGNLAVLDGYHLAWKLAAVLRGQAGAGLLESHDRERRPHAEAVADWQLANLVARQRPDLAAPEIPAWLDSATLLFGYACPSGAFVPEPPSVDPARPFEDPRRPSGRPGTRVPHVTLAGPDGPVRPRALLGPRFGVYTAAPGGASRARAAGRELGVEMCVRAVDSVAPLGAAPGGTVLVRPDGIVAWRGEDPTGLLAAGRAVLGR